MSLFSTGPQSVTVTDALNGSVQGTTTVNVNQGTNDLFTVSAPGSSPAGSPFTVTVTVLDSNGNVDTHYTGTVHFTSSDAGAILPAELETTELGGKVSIDLIRRQHFATPNAFLRLRTHPIHATRVRDPFEVEARKSEQVAVRVGFAVRRIFKGSALRACRQEHLYVDIARLVLQGAGPRRCESQKAGRDVGP